VISNQKAEHGATLVAKYKGIRFIDEDIGEGRGSTLPHSGRKVALMGGVVWI